MRCVCVRAADPSYQQKFDSALRSANGALASTMTGTIDSCGWPVSGMGLFRVSVAHVTSQCVLWLDEPCWTQRCCVCLLPHGCMQKETPAQASPYLQWNRATEVFVDEFTEGLYVSCLQVTSELPHSPRLFVTLVEAGCNIHLGRL